MNKQDDHVSSLKDKNIENLVDLKSKSLEIYSLNPARNR